MNLNFKELEIIMNKEKFYYKFKKQEMQINQIKLYWI